MSPHRISLQLSSSCMAAAVLAVPLSAQVRSGAPGCLHEIDRLVAEGHAPADNLGRAIVFDGLRAVVGATGRDGAGPGSAGIGGAIVFRRHGASWVQEAELVPLDSGSSQFAGAGISVASTGALALLGAPNDSGTGDDAGAVHTFTRDGQNWTRELPLRAADTAEGDHFGSSVALAGEFALVGARGVTDLGGFAGAAYVFEREGGVWIERAKLLAPDGGENDSFGHGAVLSADAAIVAAPYAGAPGLGRGAVYVYRKDPGGWSFAQELEASDAAQNDVFGESLALAGERLVVGARGHDGAGLNAGAMYVFELTPGGWQETAKLLPPSGAGIAQMGTTVALGPDLVLTGAPSSDAGLVEQAGAVLCFVRAPTGWVHLETFHAPSAEESAFYGDGVAWADGLGLVGATAEDTPLANAGAVHVLRLPAPSGMGSCTCTNGPCGNDDIGAGCANSTGAGALLLALGSTQPDRVTLFGRGLPPHTYALFVQGVPSSAIPFGAGLACLSNASRALHPMLRKVDANGFVDFGRCAGDPPITSDDPTLPGSGTTLAYQLAYRDPFGACGADWNVSSAVLIAW